MATASIARRPEKLLVDLILDRAAKHGDAPALLSANGALTYSQLADAIETYSHWAFAHIPPGEAVGLLMPNRPEYVAIWLGITRVGGIVALINTNLRGSALEHAIASAGLKQVIIAPELTEPMREAVPAAGLRIWSPEELRDGAGEARPHLDRPAVTIRNTALLIYTSGTTGLPKAAKVSHYRILQWSLWFAALGEFSPADRMYNCLPLYHSVGGVVAVGSLLSVGGSIAIAERFSATRFWLDVVHFECTLFQYIGELCRYLANAPPTPEERQHSLRLACGNGLRADIWTKFKERFGIPHIIEFYAATEGTFSLFNIEDEPGAIGHVPPFLRLNFPAAIVRYDSDRQEPYRNKTGRCVRCGPNEPGEALGRIGAPQKVQADFEGYTDHNETEQKILHDVFEPGDAWYRTGDLMRTDERGFICFVDRVGDTFRWKGENVSTSQVEQALSSCPGVLDLVAYGVTIPGTDGRAGMVAIVPSSDFDLAALRAIATERLPAYARPLFLRLCADVQATETFKPRKQLLAREGFDPNVISDPLYLDDCIRGTYVPLSGDEYTALLGRTRF
jgi:fatty-acyl-CoA synthase